MSKRKTPFIHRNAIKLAIHRAGFKSSRSFEAAVDELIAIKITQAFLEAGASGRKILKRKHLTTLF